MVFDTHMHFFPDKISERAIERLVGICGFPTHSLATKRDTKRLMNSWDVAGGVLLSIATNPDQQRAVNDFAAASREKLLLSFGSVHPESTEVRAEVRRIKHLGLDGIKLHPDYQDFFVDDEAAFPIYEEAEKQGLPIAFHTGVDPLSPGLVHCTPQALAKVAERFPALRIISAHMGGAYMNREAEKHLAGKENIWFDTAFTPGFMDAEKMEKMIRILGTDRVFFATDLPWATVPQVKALLEATGLTRAEREQVYYRNAFRFFEINEVDATGE